jgi:hopanoid-associated phosphorylase
MLGILCGIEAEAAIASRIEGAQVACAAARPQKARWMARELITRGVTRLLSFGIAGGLEPGLPIGSMIIGAQVQSMDGIWACDSEGVGKLMQSFPAAHCGGVWGSETLIATAREKRALYEKSRCLIVDMESQCAAQIAAEAHIPFTVLRVVCDSATMDVPPVVMAAIAEDGTVNIGRALWHIARHPRQIPDLFHVMRGTGKALKILRKTSALLSQKD